MSRKRYLVVAPHPDDAELGMGGTILNLVKAGQRVRIVDLTTGEPTPFGTECKRKAETLKANKILGIDKRINLKLPNRYLFDSKEARLLLAQQIRIFKPDIIFSPSIHDAHPDHVAARRITEGARFYAKYTGIDLKAKPHYVKYLIYYFCSHLKMLPQVSFLIDVSGNFNKKMLAIKCYKSQFILNKKNKFIFNYIKHQNQYLGQLIRCNHAEAFFTKEAIKIGDLSTIL